MRPPLAVALAPLAVFPEYAVDIVFAFKAGGARPFVREAGE